MSDWEPDYDIWDITIDGGKYQFSRDKIGVNSALRHGEPWPAWVDLYKEHLKFSHWFSSLMTEFNTARAALRIIAERGGARYAFQGMDRSSEEFGIIKTALIQIGKYDLSPEEDANTLGGHPHDD